MTYLIATWYPLCNILQRLCQIGSLVLILNPTFPIAFACGDDDVLVVVWDGVVQWLDSVDIEIRRHLGLTIASIAWCYRVNGHRSLGACRGGGEEANPCSGNLLLSETDKRLCVYPMSWFVHLNRNEVELQAQLSACTREPSVLRPKPEIF